jgi:hypothetical protein
VHAYADAAALAAGQRPGCPECGSTGVIFELLMRATAQPTATLPYSAWPSAPMSNQRRFAWGMTGWDMSLRLRRMVRKESLFDKRSDRRYEHVEDPETGTVLHHWDHRLTEHLGHGSDKSQPRR